MEIIDEYNRRKEDLNSFYTLLGYIDGIEVHKGIPLIYQGNGASLSVENNMQKCMKAHAIMMLYNLVESTFNNCVQQIYDAIHDEHLKYDELSDML